MSSPDDEKKPPVQPNESRYKTGCTDLAQKSFKCMEDTEGDRELCTPFFRAYKTCLNEERLQRLAENAKRTAF
jgi:hypothetical protein